MNTAHAFSHLFLISANKKLPTANISKCVFVCGSSDITNKNMHVTPIKTLNNRILITPLPVEYIYSKTPPTGASVP